MGPNKTLKYKTCKKKYQLEMRSASFIYDVVHDGIKPLDSSGFNSQLAKLFAKTRASVCGEGAEFEYRRRSGEMVEGEPTDERYGCHKGQLCFISVLHPMKSYTWGDVAAKGKLVTSIAGAFLSTAPSCCVAYPTPPK